MVNWAYFSGPREDTTGCWDSLWTTLWRSVVIVGIVCTVTQINQENIQPAVLYTTDLHSLWQGTAMFLLETLVQR